MVQYPERISEIKCIRRKRDLGNAVEVIANILHKVEILPGDGQRLRTGVQQMQMLDARRNKRRPPPRSATYVDTNAAVRRQPLPGKNVEIVIEDLNALIVR